MKYFHFIIILIEKNLVSDNYEKLKLLALLIK